MFLFVHLLCETTRVSVVSQGNGKMSMKLGCRCYSFTVVQFHVQFIQIDISAQGHYQLIEDQMMSIIC